MAYVSGHKGRLTWVAAAAVEDIPAEPSVNTSPRVADVTRWEIEYTRRMVEVTGFNEKSKTFVPEHYEWTARFEALYDSAQNPGWFNRRAGTIQFEFESGGDFIQGTAHVRRMIHSSSVIDLVRFVMELQGSGNITRSFT